MAGRRPGVSRWRKGVGLGVGHVRIFGTVHGERRFHPTLRHQIPWVFWWHKIQHFRIFGTQNAVGVPGGCQAISTTASQRLTQPEATHRRWHPAQAVLPVLPAARSWTGKTPAKPEPHSNNIWGGQCNAQYGPVNVIARVLQAKLSGVPRRAVVSMRMPPIPTDFYPHWRSATLSHISTPGNKS